MILRHLLILPIIFALGCTPRHSNPKAIPTTQKSNTNLPIKSFDSQATQPLPEPDTGSCSIKPEAQKDCAPQATSNGAATPSATIPEPISVPAPSPVATPVAAPAVTPVATPAPTPTPAVAPAPSAAIEDSSPKRTETDSKTETEAKKAAPETAKGQSQDTMLEKEVVDKARHKLDQAAQEAEKKAPAFSSKEEQKQWDQLMEYVVVHRNDEQDSRMGRYFSIADTEGKKPSEPHVGHFFSVIGGIDSKGQIGINRVEVINEVVRLNQDNHIRSEQWRFLLAQTGQLANFWHVTLVEDTTGHVLEEKYSDLTNEQRNSKFEEIKNYWFNRMKEGKDKVFDESAKK